MFVMLMPYADFPLALERLALYGGYGNGRRDRMGVNGDKDRCR
jgi:hypothetical protein